MSLRSYAAPNSHPYDMGSPICEPVCLGRFGWQVMSFADGLDRNILNKTYQSLTAFLSRHSKAFVIRFDISLYDSPEDNKLISKTMRSVTTSLNNRYESKAAYGWVREQNSLDDKCHYHCFVILDGHKVNKTKTTFDYARHAIELVVNAKTHFPKYCHYMVYRNDLVTFQAALYRLSYLAKNTSKQANPSKVKGYFFSRIAPRL
ncbi:inovirus-type Gp2 protein [Shewanella sp. MMG014]|uniref:YagK/YfjJ domain-containing protein n=1 Tax=Shewanella sp. MMG014 TaxID=2822691 RepID=UPI001B366654|nr:inovirus-type Gp2 protein [Shewanella sp. MMG014]MBQ4889299.1 inovirus-type Gp2 protein [Shewanella sp. MMG014]